MRYPKHLSANQLLQRFVYIGVLGMADPIATFSTWLLMGTAAVLGLLIANLGGIAPLIADWGLRWGLALLTFSMVAGVVTKQFGMGIQTGVNIIEGMYAEMETPEGDAMLKSAQMDIDTFEKEISEPFTWPLNRLIGTGARKGAVDFIRSEKRYIKLFCYQLYSSYIQGICAAAGLLILAFSIK